MFAVLHASSGTPLEALVEVAQSFTPRFQVLGPFVLLDVGGLSALFGTPEELGQAIHAACPACRSVVLGATASSALVLACGREGLTVLDPAAEHAARAALPIDVLVEVTQARLQAAALTPAASSAPPEPHGGAPAVTSSVGWRHPRDTHQAHHVRRPRVSTAAAADMRRAVMALQQCGATLRRWGIQRLGALAALPRPDVHARLGELGVSWQRLAAGEDEAPLVPWLADPVFQGLLELEWPIEGFEPLSFVLARLLEPLAARLELADRGAVAIRTALRLTNRQVHVRVIPLPAPMRDPKTLRTLVLLDLESHPPSAAIDRVQVRLEPTPGRVLQWTLFDRAQPAPEHVATLLARLTALMGDGHVGSPALVDTWRPGAFRMAPFAPGPTDDLPPPAGEAVLVPLAFRRFRLPVPVRVGVHDGRPIRVTTDRRGITGGAIVQSAGPWRTSGEWWGTTRMDQDATDRESPFDTLRATLSHVEGSGGGRESEKTRAGEDRDRDYAARRESIREGEREEPRGGVNLDRDRLRSRELPESGNEAQSREGFAPSRSVSTPSREVLVPSRQSVPSRPSAPWDRDEWDIAVADGTVYRLFVERDVGQWFLEGVFD